MYSTLDGLDRLPRVFAVMSFEMSTIAGRPLPKSLELEAKSVIRGRAVLLQALQGRNAPYQHEARSAFRGRKRAEALK